MTTAFEAISQTIGEVPRSFGFFQRMHNKLSTPNWIPYSGSYLIQIYNNQKQTFKLGKLGLAAVVQANQKIYENGLDNLPAIVVYSLDHAFVGNAAALQEIAGKLAALREQDTVGSELKPFQEALNDEKSVVYNKKLPTSLTGGKDVYYTTIMIHRIHLPNGKLEQDIMPVLAVPELEGGTVILPAKYWKDQMEAFQS